MIPLHHVPLCTYHRVPSIINSMSHALQSRDMSRICCAGLDALAVTYVLQTLLVDPSRSPRILNFHSQAGGAHMHAHAHARACAPTHGRIHTVFTTTFAILLGHGVCRRPYCSECTESVKLERVKLLLCIYECDHVCMYSCTHVWVVVCICIDVCAYIHNIYIYI